MRSVAVVSSQEMVWAEEVDCNSAEDISDSLALGEVRIQVFDPGISLKSYSHEESWCVEVYSYNYRTKLLGRLKLGLSGDRREVFNGARVVSNQEIFSGLVFDPCGTESASSIIHGELCHFKRLECYSISFGEISLPLVQRYLILVAGKDCTAVRLRRTGYCVRR